MTGRKALLCATTIFLLLVVPTSLVRAAPEPEINRAQMTFDTAPITSEKPLPGKSLFKWDGFLYARVFYDRPIKEVFGFDDRKYTVFVYEKMVESGVRYTTAAIFVPRAAWEQKYLDLEIFPDPAKARTKYRDGFTDSFYQAWFNEPSPSKKEPVIFQIEVKDPKDNRKAVIQIDFTGFKLDQLRATAKKVGAAGDAAWSTNVGLPERGRGHNAGLAKKLEAVAKKAWGVKGAKVIIVDDDWNIERHPISGKITGRTLGAAVILKQPDGKCMLYRRQMVRQLKVGGFKAPGEWARMGDAPLQIDCARAFGK